MSAENTYVPPVRGAPAAARPPAEEPTVPTEPSGPLEGAARDVLALAGEQLGKRVIRAVVEDSRLELLCEDGLSVVYER